MAGLLDSLSIASSSRSSADGISGFDSSGWTVATAGGNASATRSDAAGSFDPGPLLVALVALAGLALMLRKG